MQQLKLVRQQPETEATTADPSHQVARAALTLNADTLSDGQLVATLIGEDAATELLEHLPIHQLHRLPDLARGGQCPISHPQTTRLLAAIELAARVARTKLARRNLLNEPELAASYLTQRYFSADQELVGALFLDTQGRLIDERILYQGTINRTALEPRLILRTALDLSADKFVLFHNHPSGDPTPSADDLHFTRRLSDAAELLGIRLVDHLVIGTGNRWVALGRHGCW